MKILHIACHLGGGIGAVIDNWIKNDKDNVHTIACLNPNDDRSWQIEGAYHDLRNWPEKLDYLIKCNDVIVLHWYNNPVLYEFLCLHQMPECRLMVWAHSNCLNPPYVIPENLVNMCDRFIFTSPVSYHAKEYLELSDEQKNKFGVIWSVSDLTKFYNIKKVKHETFNVGYVGTIDLNSKMHHDFVSMCRSIDIADIKFIVCGGGPDLELLKSQVKAAGLAEKFTITGQISQDELLGYYAQMDVFGYPLYEKHIGTCEQVLGEAMAAGVVPVVLDNAPEHFIIDNDVNGVICHGIEPYMSIIKELHNTPYWKLELQNGLYPCSHMRYSTHQMIFEWDAEISIVAMYPKSKKSWYGNNVGSYLFKESIGKYAKSFANDDRTGIVELLRHTRQWKSASKGSIKQYAKCFPEDKNLKEWEGIAGEIK
jgi:L-malate glycosyltransferase